MERIFKCAALSCAVILVFVNSPAMGFRQEFLIYGPDSPNPMYKLFAGVYDTNDVPLIHQYTRLCVRGEWNCFSNTNYTGNIPLFDDLMWDDQFHCYDAPEAGYNKRFPCKSFRPSGFTETDQPVLTLYSEKKAAGHELHVMFPELPSIPEFFNGEVKSVSWTGASNWTLFERPDFSGLAYCLDVSQPSKYHTLRDVLKISELGSIGSVMRGCDPSHFSLSFSNALPRVRWALGYFGSSVRNLVYTPPKTGECYEDAMGIQFCD